MAYTRDYALDSNPGGDTGKQAFIDLDADLTSIFTDLNTHEALTTGAHGVGAGTIVGTTLTQTLTNKTIQAATLTGAFTGTGLTLTSGTIVSPTISAPTITGTVTASGATISAANYTAGTATNLTLSSPTLTSTVTASGATITGGTTVNQTVQAATLTGTITCTGATISNATMTNSKSIPRVLSITSSATPEINTDLYDAVTITALATTISSMTTSLSGTPYNFQKLLVRIKDDGSARSITWGTSFASKGVTLPTTTTASKLLTVGLIYNSVTTDWECVAAASEV
jgi:hypothetical protein